MEKIFSRILTASKNEEFLLPPGEGQEEGVLNQVVACILSPLPNPLPVGEGVLSAGGPIDPAFSRNPKPPALAGGCSLLFPKFTTGELLSVLQERLAGANRGCKPLLQ